MLRFFSNLVLLYPKIGALVAQECGVPGAQAAQAMFGTPEPRPIPLVKVADVPEVARRAAVLPIARRQTPRRRKVASMKKKARRKAA